MDHLKWVNDSNSASMRFVLDQCKHFRFAVFWDDSVLSEQSSHGPRASNQVSFRCKSSYKSIYSLEIDIRLSCALFGSSQGHGRSGGWGKKAMGGVVVQLSGGVLFCNLSNGRHFYKFFCLCIRENFKKRLKKCCRIQIRKRMFIQQINQGYLTLQWRPMTIHLQSNASIKSVGSQPFLPFWHPNMNLR